MFDDPRGPLPPFDNRVTIYPKQGDLILFPSWLIHSVSPTPGEEPRISIPFNIEGRWDATTGLLTKFAVK
jgi:predicted 2-oxoglutarate/Fe(II)-dependent dioxygenase YbiX